MKYYKHNHVEAIVTLFPELKWDLKLFNAHTRDKGMRTNEDNKIKRKTKYRTDIWTDIKDRRRFFDNFAKEMKFDPLVASNWYSITLEDVIDHGVYIPF